MFNITFYIILPFNPVQNSVWVIQVMLGYVRRMLSVISAGLKEKVPYVKTVENISSKDTNKQH